MRLVGRLAFASGSLALTIAAVIWWTCESATRMGDAFDLWIED